MNKTLVSKTRIRLTRTAAASLIVLSTAIAISALTAESPGTSYYRRGECKDWPHEGDKAKFAAGFDEALKQSITDDTLREKLLRSDHSSTAAVEDILHRLYPGDKLKFPPKTVMRFYEPETAVPGWSGLGQDLLPNYPSDHCIHVFYLPEKDKTAGSEPSFKKNLMCCYKPW